MVGCFTTRSRWINCNECFLLPEIVLAEYFISCTLSLAVRFLVAPILILAFLKLGGRLLSKTCIGRRCSLSIINITKITYENKMILVSATFQVDVPVKTPKTTIHSTYMPMSHDIVVASHRALVHRPFHPTVCCR